jgi:uncharacterized protein (DUF2141 family)
MRSITNISMIILLIYSFAFSQTGKIFLEISGFKNNKGLVRIVLFNQSKGFPSEYKYGLVSKSQPVDTSFISVTFDSISYGAYAVSVLHDENKNGEMDTNILGIPREGYGVSNNVNPKMRSPRFDEALFSLKNPIKKLKIILNYR